jgi:hypothetical protein
MKPGVVDFLMHAARAEYRHAYDFDAILVGSDVHEAEEYEEFETDNQQDDRQ